MRVIFDKTFLSKLSDRSGFLEITKYSLVRDWRKITNISELFNESYVQGDVKHISENLSETMWEVDLRLLRLCIDLPENRKEDFINDSYKFIYCYYKENVGEENKIAFILFNSNNDDISELIFNNIEFTLSKNLINVSFPENINAIIKTRQSEDTKFLEGPGISVGINIFNAIPNKDDLVSKKSYYTYLKNYKCNAYNVLDVPSLNIKGEKLSKSIYRTFSNLILTMSGINIDNYEKPTVDNLDINGGILKLTGTIDYQEYEIINGTKLLIKTGTLNIDELDTLKINCIDTGKGVLIDYSIDYKNKQIIYKKNTNPNQQAQGNIFLEYSFKNENNLIETIKSNEIIVIQGESDGSWDLNITTRFRENNIPVYIIDYAKDSSCSFTIHTNIDDTPEFEFEDELIKTFFDFSLQKISTSNGFKITVTIISKTTNQGTTWNPTIIESEELISKLILAKVKLRDHQAQFYCIQRYELGKFKVLEKSEQGYKEVDSIIFENGQSDKLTKYLYLLQDVNNEEERFNYWTLISADSEIEITPLNGELNSGDPDEWVDSPKYLSVTSLKRPETTSKKIYSNLILARIDETDLSKDLNNWRNYISVSPVEIPISREGEPIYVSTTTSEITLTDINVYKFLVKSNCSFKCTYIPNYSSESEAIKFYDTSLDYFISEEFNKTSGVYVYFKFLNTSTSYLDLGKIKITPVDDVSPEVFINLYAELITPSIEKLDPITDYIFLSDEYNVPTTIKYFCNLSTNISYPQSVNISEDVIFDKKEGGYMYHTANVLSTSNEELTYPISPLGKLQIYAFNNYNSDSINYTIYKKGARPYITTLGQYVAIIEKKAYDYVDIPFMSRYKINNSISIDLNNPNYSIEYTLSDLGYSGYTNFYDYVLRITALQNNTNKNDIYIGTIKITSEILPSEFIVNERWDQEFINNIAPPATEIIDIYQNGTGEGADIGISGDKNSIVNIFGDSREYRVFGLEEGYYVELSNISTGLIATYDSDKEKIVATVKSKFPEDYKPYLVKTDKSYINIFLINDTINSFVATIKSATDERILAETIKLTQPGLYHGLLFRSDDIDNTLFLANNDLNIVELSIDSDITEVSFCAGIFNISKELLIGDIGKEVKISSTDLDKSKYVYEIDTSAKYSETGDYNISIKFPANTSDFENKRIFTISGTGSDNSKVTHSLTLIITQAKKEWKVYPIEGELIKVHSSGYIINDTTSFSYSIETDIPEGNLQIWSEGLEIFNVTTKEESSSSHGSNFKRISINFTVPANHSGSLRTGNLCIGYKDTPTSRNNSKIWEGIIKQGYFTAKLKSEEDGIIYYPGDSIGTELNPIEYPERNSGIIPYPVNVVQCEVTDDGVLGNEVVLNVEDWDIITPNNDPGNSNNTWYWNTYLNGEIVNNGADTYLEKYLTSRYKEYSDESLGSKCPFIANEYIVKPIGAYYRTELVFEIQMWIFARYPENNGILISESDRLVDDFHYKFWIKKKAAPEPEVSINPVSVDVSENGGEIEFTVTSNIDLTLTSPDWINQKNISGNKYTYIVNANNTNSERTGKITATNIIEWGDNSKSITIKQAGKSS